LPGARLLVCASAFAAVALQAYRSNSDILVGPLSSGSHSKGTLTTRSSLEDLNARTEVYDAVSSLVREDHVLSAGKTLLLRRRFNQYLHKKKGKLYWGGVRAHGMQ
jgi:hypothetical protein